LYIQKPLDPASFGNDLDLLSIDFVGVFRDRPDHAMPGQSVRLATDKMGQLASQALSDHLCLLTNWMQEQGKTTGFFSIQDNNEVYISVGPTALHERHGKLGGKTAGRKINALELTQPSGSMQFEGVVDVVGGGWENAVYRVELVLS
jgi:hypothetical protein